MCCNEVIMDFFGVILAFGLPPPGEEEVRRVTANRNNAITDNEYSRLINSQSSSYPRNT